LKKILGWLKNVIGDKMVALIIVNFLTAENIKKVVTEILDAAEEFAKKTDTKLDDMVVQKLKEIVGISKE